MSLRDLDHVPTVDYMRVLGERDALALAGRAWLEFDGEVEPPDPEASYADFLAYEKQKIVLTERLAGLVQDALGEGTSHRSQAK